MRSILIVEDDQDIRVTLSEVFESEGYEVQSAANGREGLELLRKCRPSLVLLDLMMPIMTGWEFLEARKSDQELAQIPVVVMSAATLDARPEAEGFVRKPLSLDSLLPIAMRLAEDTPVLNRLAC